MLNHVAFVFIELFFWLLFTRSWCVDGSEYDRQSLLARYSADILRPRDIHKVQPRELYVHIQCIKEFIACRITCLRERLKHDPNASDSHFAIGCAVSEMLNAQVSRCQKRFRACHYMRSTPIMTVF